MKEFLVTNENGSYANMEITGKLRRMYAGYLVASLTPPQDRVVVLEWISEHIVNGRDEIDSDIYRSEFLPGLKDVEYAETGFMPQMRLSADILDFTRTIMFGSKDRDIVKVIYNYSNKTGHDIKIILEPRLTFRRPDSPAKWGELNFDTQSPVDVSSGNAYVNSGDAFTATFVPHTNTYPEIPCRITLMAGSGDANITVKSPKDPTQHFNEDHRYYEDEATGDPDVKLWGVCYSPYRFEFIVPANGTVEASILCEVHRTDNIDSQKERDCKTFIENFYSTSAKAYLNEMMPQWNDNFAKAHVDEVARKFADYPETATLYKELVISASKFITRKSGTPYSTIMAGYPWFLDWGRDTMIAYTGLLLVTGRFDAAKNVLRSFARYVRNGMVPNVFSGNSAEEPQYNTVDASLWFFYAADMYARFSGDDRFVRSELVPVLREIIALYTRTKTEMLNAPKESFCYGIYTDSDGFVHAGTDESDQLTWMDVRIDGKAVTPRHDCPVEIQALMYNALCVMAKYDVTDCAKEYKLKAEKLRSNCMQFYNEAAGYLYDYMEGEPGNRTPNGQLRPNQIWAISLPYSMYSDEIARKILETVKETLVVDLGLRSLSPDDEGYISKYEGCLKSRDQAYHNGTSWGFLAGHYIMAYLKFFGCEEGTDEYIHNLLKPYLKHSEDNCIYGIAEVFDGDAPAEGKGCYNQAWSVGCLLEAIYKMSKSL